MQDARPHPTGGAWSRMTPAWPCSSSCSLSQQSALRTSAEPALVFFKQQDCTHLNLLPVAVSAIHLLTEHYKPENDEVWSWPETTEKNSSLAPSPCVKFMVLLIQPNGPVWVGAGRAPEKTDFHLNFKDWLSKPLILVKYVQRKYSPWRCVRLPDTSWDHTHN